MISAACFTSSQRGRMKNTVFGSSNVLIGASRPEQIIQNVEIVQNTKFTREELKKIDQISRGNL